MARGKKKESALTPEEKLAQALVPVEEQPYKVPENWQYVFLSGATTRIKRGKAPKYVESSDYPVFAQKCNQKDGTISIAKAQFLNPALVERLDDEEFLRDNDVVINSTGTGTLGRVGFYKSEYAFPYKKVLPDSHVTVVRAEKFVLPQYLFFFLKNTQDYLELQGVGSTNQKELRPETIGAQCFPLPPIAEQQRIVDRIEYLFSKLDEAKEKAQSVLDSFETRKAAILHEAFIGELTAKWRMENGATLENIEKVPLGKLTRIVSSKRIYKEEYVETGVPFFRSSEIVELHDYGMTTPEFFISRQRYEEIKKQYGVPSAGDLLVTSVGTIGKTWIVDGREFYYKDGNLTQVMQCESLDMKYLQYFIKSEFFKQQVSDTVAGSAYNALTIVKFKKILIPLVGLAEQAEIVRILDSLFAKEQQAKEAAEAVLEKIDLLKKSILARAFRGELGTNDPSEESALELLKTILLQEVRYDL